MTNRAKDKSRNNGIYFYQEYLSMRHNEEIAMHGTLGFRCAANINKNHISFVIYYCDQFSFSFNMWNKICSKIFLFFYFCNNISPGILLYYLNRKFCIDYISSNVYKIVGIETLNFYLSNIITCFLIHILYDLFFFNGDCLSTVKNINIYIVNPCINFNYSDIMQIDYISSIIKKNKKEININFYILVFSALNNSQNLSFLKNLGNVTFYHLHFDTYLNLKLYCSAFFNTRAIYLHSVVFGRAIDCLDTYDLYDKNEFINRIYCELSSEQICTLYKQNFFTRNNVSSYYDLLENFFIVFVLIHDYFLSFIGVLNINMKELLDKKIYLYLFSSFVFIFSLLSIFFILLVVFLQNSFVQLILDTIIKNLEIFHSYITNKLIFL